MTRFQWETFSRAALVFAETAESVNSVAGKTAPLGDVKAAGADSSVSTLIDDAIAAIFSASVSAVGENLTALAAQLSEESNGLYSTGQLYHDIEAANALSSEQITAALGTTPFN